MRRDRMDVPPWEPPLAGSEEDHVVGSLERMRATFRWKADGLSTEQLRQRAVPTSELTVGGLLKHLAVDEDDMFAWKLAGRPPETWLLAPEGEEPGLDRKSTRLNSSHVAISYAVFCLKKKPRDHT